MDVNQLFLLLMVMTAIGLALFSEPLARRRAISQHLPPESASEIRTDILVTSAGLLVYGVAAIFGYGLAGFIVLMAALIFELVRVVIRHSARR